MITLKIELLGYLGRWYTGSYLEVENIWSVKEDV